MLRSRLYEHEMRKQMARMSSRSWKTARPTSAGATQIRSYVLDQSRIKDLRTNVEISNAEGARRRSRHAPSSGQPEAGRVTAWAAFLFDLDSTLIDSMPHHHDAWVAWHARRGLSLDADAFFAATAGRNDGSGRDVPGRHARRAGGDGRRRKRCTADRGAAPETDRARRPSSCAPAPGLRLAVCTASTPENMALAFARFPIRDWVETVVSPADGLRGKPHGHLSRSARRLGRAGAMLVFGCAAGHRAARRAGMGAVALTTTLPDSARRLPNLLAGAPDFRALDPLTKKTTMREALPRPSKRADYARPPTGSAASGSPRPALRAPSSPATRGDFYNAHRRPARLRRDIEPLRAGVTGRRVLPRRGQRGSSSTTRPEGDFHARDPQRTCAPKNAQLSGARTLGRRLLHRCEAEGFRRITYFLDRPDVMAVFSRRCANKSRYRCCSRTATWSRQGDLDNGRHFAEKWRPSETRLPVRAGRGRPGGARAHIRTRSGKNTCWVWVRRGDLDKTEHAMNSLIASVVWDEARAACRSTWSAS